RRKKEREQEIARGGVPFPLPKIIGGREYYQLGALRHYRDSRPHVRVVHAPPPPTPPKGRRWKKGEKLGAAATANNTESEFRAAPVFPGAALFAVSRRAPTRRVSVGVHIE